MIMTTLDEDTVFFNYRMIIISSISADADLDIKYASSIILSRLDFATE